ncbi:putative DNA-binding transcriptional regulator YafY [Lachnospiraceae bacterium PFB1-21]
MAYTIPSKKLLIINILDILKKYSDADHPLSAKDIGDRLEHEYMQKTDRKAIKRNLMNLIESGYDIEYSETTRINKKGEQETLYSDWYLKRDFTDAEIRLLIDSLLFSKTISSNQCKELITKLEDLSNTYFRGKAKHIYPLPENMPENKQVFYTIEIIDEAIETGKQVAFEYIEYGIKKEPLSRVDKETGQAKEYVMSPYQMAATNGRYYLICNRTGYPRISHYRIDRIQNIRLLEDSITPLRTLPGYENGLNLPLHMAEHVYMFAGESVHVIFHTTEALIGDVMDWFGRDVKLKRLENDVIQVVVKVNENAMFYWALQYGMGIEIKEPLSLRKKLADAAKTLVGKYTD